jgi:hypothetical protein
VYAATTVFHGCPTISVAKTLKETKNTDISIMRSSTAQDVEKQIHAV